VMEPLPLIPKAAVRPNNPNMSAIGWRAAGPLSSLRIELAVAMQLPLPSNLVSAIKAINSIEVRPDKQRQSYKKNCELWIALADRIGDEYQ